MAEDHGYPANFFRTNEIIHCMAGLWLFKNEEVPIRRRCIQYLWTLLVYVFAMWIFVLEFLIFSETVKDINKFISQFGLLLCHCLGILKVSILVFQHDKLQKLMDILQDRNYRYEPIADFNPGKKLQEAKKLSHWFSVTLFCLYTLVGVSAHISSEVIINKEVKGEYFERNETCYDYMPYYFVLPFTVNNKRQCEYTFIFMDYSLDTFAFFISCHDGFYAALLNCLKCQLDILSDAMKTIRKRVLKRLNLPETFQIFHDEDFPNLEEALYQEQKRLFKHLIILLKVADDLEVIFNMVTLCQIVASLIIFASCLFVAASVSVTSPEFFAQVEYFMCMFIQISIFCWFGSGITRASERIMFSLYDSDWYTASRRFKSSMLTTMYRMQRPIYLSVGKFCPLTLDALVSVSKGSFSYYTVFKTVKE